MPFSPPVSLVKSALIGVNLRFLFWRLGGSILSVIPCLSVVPVLVPQFQGAVAVDLTPTLV
jgi:hypothetical protein